MKVLLFLLSWVPLNISRLERDGGIWTHAQHEWLTQLPLGSTFISDERVLFDLFTFSKDIKVCLEHARTWFSEILFPITNCCQYWKKELLKMRTKCLLGKLNFCKEIPTSWLVSCMDGVSPFLDHKEVSFLILSSHAGLRIWPSYFSFWNIVLVRVE